MADAEDFDDIVEDLIADHVVVSGDPLPHVGSRDPAAAPRKMPEAFSGGAQCVSDICGGARV